MTTIHGTCDPRFDALRDEFAARLDSGEELGASICVMLDGEPVVDLWGGHADADRTEPWGRDTIVNVFSITKTMTALCALILVDRSLLDLDRPVAHYWPEFAANGKDDVLVRHLLSHTSGVSAWERPVELQDIYNTDEAAARLAGQPPWWEPGTASGYHALNFGHLIGELVRRIDGRSLGDFFDDEIARPVGADFHIGTGPEHHGRIAPIVPPPPLEFDLGSLDQDSVLVKTLTCPLLDMNEVNSASWRQAQIGAANGHGNARSIARIQSLVSCGGEVDGVRLLSPSTVERIFDEQIDGVDLGIATPLRFGIGYGLPHPVTVPTVRGGKVAWWAGFGGSMLVNDADNRMTFAYAMNAMAPGLIGSDRSEAYLRATNEALAGTDKEAIG